ncbi:MAG: U32 family peptidase [Clostridia bacterium]|nr:U32 family peptidase [Clostridia bacterium]
MQITKPELLAPAGDFEILQSAVQSGADAVYIGAKIFGMRTASSNFSYEEIKKAVSYCHSNNVKLYVTCNTLPRNNELSEIDEFFKMVNFAKVDAVIVTDIGLFAKAKELLNEDIEIHISTQAGIVNSLTAKTFENMGADRIILARELSFPEIKNIKESLKKETVVECFVHGAMCMSFSGRCLISSYLTGRDSNRGDCAQCCRWKYSLVEEKRPGEYFPVIDDGESTFLFNSKDLSMIEYIPELVNAGIGSFKIEGRAKSAYYVSTITKAYRRAIDEYFEHIDDKDYKLSKEINDEIYKVSHRPYCTGFYFDNPHENAQVDYKGGYIREYEISAIVEEIKNNSAIIRLKNKFFDGDELEAVTTLGDVKTIKVSQLKDDQDVKVDFANRPEYFYSIKDEKLEVGTILRRKL